MGSPSPTTTEASVGMAAARLLCLVFLVARSLCSPVPQRPFFDFAAFPVASVHPSPHLPAPHFKKPPIVPHTPHVSHHHVPAAPYPTHHTLPEFHHTFHKPVHQPVHHHAHEPARIVYTPAPVYTQAPITYNGH